MAGDIQKSQLNPHAPCFYPPSLLQGDHIWQQTEDSRTQPNYPLSYHDDTQPTADDDGSGHGEMASRQNLSAKGPASSVETVPSNHRVANRNSAWCLQKGDDREPKSRYLRELFALRATNSHKNRAAGFRNMLAERESLPEDPYNKRPLMPSSLREVESFDQTTDIKPPLTPLPPPIPMGQSWFDFDDEDEEHDEDNAYDYYDDEYADYDYGDNDIEHEEVEEQEEEEEDNEYHNLAASARPFAATTDDIGRSYDLLYGSSSEASNTAPNTAPSEMASNMSNERSTNILFARGTSNLSMVDHSGAKIPGETQTQVPNQGWVRLAEKWFHANIGTTDINIISNLRFTGGAQPRLTFHGARPSALERYFEKKFLELHNLRSEVVGFFRHHFAVDSFEEAHEALKKRKEEQHEFLQDYYGVSNFEEAATEALKQLELVNEAKTLRRKLEMESYYSREAEKGKIELEQELKRRTEEYKGEMKALEQQLKDIALAESESTPFQRISADATDSGTKWSNVDAEAKAKFWATCTKEEGQARIEELFQQVRAPLEGIRKKQAQFEQKRIEMNERREALLEKKRREAAIARKLREEQNKARTEIAKRRRDLRAWEAEVLKKKMEQARMKFDEHKPAETFALQGNVAGAETKLSLPVERGSEHDTGSDSGEQTRDGTEMLSPVDDFESERSCILS